jgi:hypothetical protein
MNKASSITSLRPRSVVALGVICASLVLGACGRAAPDTAVSTDGADLSAPVSSAPVSAAAATDAPSTASGVSGVDVVPPSTATGIDVLSDTVTARSDTGRWSATGLVRNDTLDTVGTVTVVAELVGADGGVLDRPSATSAVHDIRPGEPVPFDVSSGIEAAQVSEVRWSATADGTGNPAVRQLAVATFWTRDFGDPRPVHLPSYDERDDQRPFLAFGSLTAATAADVVDRPHIVTAFVDGDGRVRTVVVSPALAPDGSTLSSLAAGHTGDTLVRVDDPLLGPSVASWTPMIWGTRG